MSAMAARPPLGDEPPPAEKKGSGQASAAARKKLEEFRQRRAAAAAQGLAPAASPAMSREGSPATSRPGTPAMPGDDLGDAGPAAHAEAAAGLAIHGASAGGINSLWDRIQNLEVELRSARAEAAQFRAAAKYEQQRSASLASEVAGFESERLSWAREQDTRTAEARALSQELQHTQEALLKVEALNSSLQQNMSSITMERDAAIVAKEDLATQLRIHRRRLQEAEEEQLRAEEDTAALRAELEKFHRESGQQLLKSAADTSEDLRRADQAVDVLKVEVQDALYKLQNEQKRTASERQRYVVLTVEKEGIEQELAQAKAEMQELEQAKAKLQVALEEVSVATEPHKNISEVADATSETAVASTISASDNKLEDITSGLQLSLEKLQDEKKLSDEKLRELAVMVERQEKGRQRLLAEIDKQSAEIERLFIENAGLAAGMKEASVLSSQWEAQVQECLNQNAALRSMLVHLREDSQFVEAGKLTPPREQGSPPLDEGQGTRTVADEKAAVTVDEDNTQLKVQLAEALAKAEDNEGKLAQLSADYIHAVQCLTSLSRLYKPALLNIQSKLQQFKA